MSTVQETKLTVLYLRTSTEHQQNSIDSQRVALEQFCKSRGITQYKVFQDAGVSGTRSSRPGLDAMMTLIRSGQVSQLLVYSFSRFARNTKHLIDALDEFQKLGVGFISISENIDSGTAIGKAMFTVISCISSLERDLISERVKCGLNGARARGKKLGKPKTVNSALILELHKKGVKQARIAALARCHPSTVSRELKRLAA